MLIKKNKGYVIWFTGLSGSGKTTLGTLLKEVFEKRNKTVEMVDGDLARKFFEDELGYTRYERIQNVKRIVFAAKVLSDNGINVIVNCIAPYYEVRDFIRDKISNYTQIYLRASFDALLKRDKKGLYQRFKNGEAKNIIGCDEPYDTPRKPDLIIDTDKLDIEKSMGEIINLLNKKGII